MTRRLDILGQLLRNSHFCAHFPLLILAAHPDDETIGAGTLIFRTRFVQIIHVTDGAPFNMRDARAAGFSTRDAYAEQRRLEAREALSRTRVPSEAIHCLKFADQDTSFRLEDLTEAIVDVFTTYQPRIVLTHAYEGGHPDHDSVAFASRQATEIYNRDSSRVASGELPLYEFTSYHAAQCGIETCHFLACGGDSNEYRLRLSGYERSLKIAMLGEYTSQVKTLAPFAKPEFERFRRAPDYDFSRPPHQGTLFYENFDWGIDGHTWRRLAQCALRKFHGTGTRLAL